MTLVNTDQPHILVVDDDDRIRDLLKRFLTREGYRVTAASDAAAARRMMATLDFDLTILDIMMPGEDGLSLLSAMREGLNKTTPVMLLTARSESQDRIKGLKIGADDYLAKPFEPEELSLRCAAILRRSHTAPPPDELEMSGLVFNAARGELHNGSDRIKLTDAELQLLTVLAGRAGEPVTREEISEITSAGLGRSVDVQVTRLRRKIEPNPKDPIHLQTVRGVGYRLMPD